MLAIPSYGQNKPLCRKVTANPQEVVGCATAVSHFLRKVRNTVRLEILKTGFSASHFHPQHRKKNYGPPTKLIWWPTVLKRLVFHLRYRLISKIWDVKHFAHFGLLGFCCENAAGKVKALATVSGGLGAAGPQRENAFFSMLTVVSWQETWAE
jgi:hypothetical protein